jgi:heat shock protein HtpX
VALVFALLAPVLAQVIYFAASRRREYLADAGAAVMTRYPDGLASALELLGGSSAPKLEASRATAPLYIINPLNTASLSGWFSTHPPLTDRISILRGMGGGGEVSYQGYQQAWTSVSGSGGMPASTLGLAAVPLRGASAPGATGGPREARVRSREAYDTVRKANQYKFIECPCGLRIKVPPACRETTVTCPRCDRTHDLQKD